MTTVILIILIAGAAALIVLSIVFTVKMFSAFSGEKSAGERTAEIKAARVKMIACDAGAALLVTAAALEKLLM